MTRTVKIMLMLCAGLWGLVGGLGNLLDYAGGVAQVAFVMSMAGTGDAAGTDWRSIQSPALAQAAFVVIYGAKLLTGMLCLACAWQLFRRRAASAAEFHAAKRAGILGLAISVVMLFVAFITVAGLFFEYWRVPTYGMITHQYAAIYLMCLIGFLVVLILPDPAEG